MTPHDARFSEIYAEHAPHVGRVARHFGVPGAQLPDVTQEVWLSVFRQLENVDLSRPLRPWLTGVVWNHVRHLRRSHARHARKEQALVVAEEVAGRTGEAPTSRTEAAWTLETVLGDLPEEQREILLLCDGEGLSAPEVSEALGVQLNTVYSRLRLARRRCQSLAATLGAAGLVALLERYCEEVTPSAAELAEGAMRLEAATHAIGGVAVAGTTVAAGTRSSTAWLPVTTIATVVAGLAVAWQLRVQEAPVSESVPAPVVATRAAEVAPVVREPAVEEEAVVEEPAVASEPAPVREPTRPRPQKRRSAVVEAAPPPVIEAPAPGRSSLNAEHRILADARSALSSGRTGEALALLGEHRRDFPGSRSADIRDLMLVQIHCGRGDGERARAIAANYPGDPQFAALTGRRCG